MSTEPKPLALTMGDPAGIGGEIAIAAWRDGDVPPFFLIDDADRLAALQDRLGWGVKLRRIEDPAQVGEPGGLPVLHRPLVVSAVPGEPDSVNARCVIEAIAEAVRLTQSGKAAAVVTNPIHKETLYRAGFGFPGHTEFLADLAGGDPVVMMLACPELRVVPVTVHLSLKDAIAALDEETILVAARIVERALRREFGISHPRLAVAGLNPHAGEGGALGREDQEIIAPAIAKLAAEGLDIRGPVPPDTMFHAEARETYDAALCMYHDQALIPIKTLDFYGGVNVTLGLPFIRTSPDHGTAFGLAGTGKANPASLKAALRLAFEMAARHG